MSDLQDESPQGSKLQDDEVEVVGQGRSPAIVRHKGIYLLPNLFTTGALFAGFYSIVSGMNGAFVSAAVAILVAGVLDGMDGGVARMTNTQSRFGAEYDSLSDCVAFGVAPGLLAYTYGLHSLGKLGWAVAFIFVACGALRLARFNVQSEVVDKRFFIGLPSPSAAGFLAALVWFFASSDVAGTDISWLVALATTAAGLLMMSPFKYHSFKEYHIGRVPFRVLLGIIVVFAVILVRPPQVLMILASIYVLSGIVLSLLRFQRSGEM